VGRQPPNVENHCSKRKNIGSKVAPKMLMKLTPGKPVQEALLHADFLSAISRVCD